MPNWGQVLSELQETGKKNPLDIARRKYLAIMNRYTGRNVIAYYSGWLQKHQMQLQLMIMTKML